MNTQKVLKTEDLIRIDNLNRYISERYNGNTRAFGKAINFSNTDITNLSNSLAKKRALGTAIALRIETALKIIPGTLSKINCMFSSHPSNSTAYISTYNQEIAKQYAINTEILEENGWHADDLRVMPVPDGGMEPLITEKALVLIDTSQTEIESGKIYAVQFGNDILIRRIIKEAGSEQYIAAPATFAFINQPFTTETATILGRLIYRMGEKF